MQNENFATRNMWKCVLCSFSTYVYIVYQHILIFFSTENWMENHSTAKHVSESMLHSKAHLLTSSKFSFRFKECEQNNQCQKKLTVFMVVQWHTKEFGLREPRADNENRKYQSKEMGWIKKELRDNKHVKMNGNQSKIRILMAQFLWPLSDILTMHLHHVVNGNVVEKLLFPLRNFHRKFSFSP